MTACFGWLGLVLVVAFIDKVDVGEGAMAVHCSQSLVEVEGVLGVAANVDHCHLAMNIILNK